MYQSSVLQHRQRIQQLSRKHLDKLQAQASELIVLDQLVEIGCQTLKDDAEMSMMNEAVQHP